MCIDRSVVINYMDGGLSTDSPPGHFLHRQLLVFITEALAVEHNPFVRQAKLSLFV